MIIHGVIPAAGKGSRLGMGIPKFLVPIKRNITTLDLLRRRFEPYVTHTHLITAPEARSLLDLRSNESIYVQRRAQGMGDAVFCAREGWMNAADAIAIVWGDQALLSEQTVRHAIRMHQSSVSRQATVPLAHVVLPYVDYIISPNSGNLQSIRQSREGDKCRKSGISDVGLFIVSTNGLYDAWNNFNKVCCRGNLTGELNFLPFLLYLTKNGWRFQSFKVPNSKEARGINTSADLAFVRQNLEVY